jgi:hypothetical protein
VKVPSVPEHEIRGRELLQPKPCRAAGIAQNIMRSQDDQNFHLLAPVVRFVASVVMPLHGLNTKRYAVAVVRWYRCQRLVRDADFGSIAVIQYHRPMQLR